MSRMKREELLRLLALVLLGGLIIMWCRKKLIERNVFIRSAVRGSYSQPDIAIFQYGRTPRLIAR